MAEYLAWLEKVANPSHSFYKIIISHTRTFEQDLAKSLIFPQIERRDISVAGRILSQFPDFLTEEQRYLDR